MKSMLRASTQGTAQKLCRAFAKRLNNTGGTKLQNRSAAQPPPSIAAPHKSIAQPPPSEPSNRRKQNETQKGTGHSCVSFRYYFDSGSGRTWNFTILLVLPLPPSAWNGARVANVVQIAFPFQPPFGASMRPSIPLA